MLLVLCYDHVVKHAMADASCRRRRVPRRVSYRIWFGRRPKACTPHCIHVTAMLNQHHHRTSHRALHTSLCMRSMGAHCQRTSQRLSRMQVTSRRASHRSLLTRLCCTPPYSALRCLTAKTARTAVRCRMMRASRMCRSRLTRTECRAGPIWQGRQGDDEHDHGERTDVRPHRSKV